MKMVATIMGIMIGFVNLVPPQKSISEDNFMYRELFNPNGYCDVQECKFITCSNMSKQGIDVSVIISDFISSNFKIQCPHETQISSLKFKNCSFPKGISKSFWQVIEFSIINLIFEDCLINSIEESGFSSSSFESTKNIEIINSSVRKLTKEIFNNFHNLVRLTIRDTLIEEAELNLLENVADVLQIIELDRSISNEIVLKNITSGIELLKVELMSMQGNNISHLSSEILSSFPNILSIYLDSSQIKNIDVDAFQSLKLVKQIFINNNLLSTLDENTFNVIISQNPNIRIMMKDNPWNCNCTFQWIQKLVKEKPNLFGIIPKCETPERNYGLDFLEADFCDSEPLVDIKNCEKILLPLENPPPLPAKINGFSITEYYKNGSVFVNLRASKNPQSLIWFRNSDIISTITCSINVNNSVVLHDIEKNSAYVLCLVDMTQGLSPFNCLAIMTPREEIIWLENDDKPITIIIIISIAIVSLIAGGAIAFFIILKNPQLIRSSPRVIMVKKGQINAMILPKGVLWRKEERSTEILKNNLLPEYLTPIPRRTNLIFQGNYYDSIRKWSSHYHSSPHTNLIKSLRNNKTCNNSYDVPPPLPPHPKFGMLNTVSQAVEPECPDLLEPAVYFL